MKNLVKQTLERDFDLPQYTDFIKNLFNEIQIQPQEIKVPDTSREFIKKITFLSDFSDTQKKTIDIYAVELVGGTKVERARSFQRNLISKLLKDNTKDAGLAAFYSKDNPDWRLSFIKLDYKLTDKGVKVEVGTPPKRYSFLVGEAEPSHTAQKQLLPILEDHKNNPLLSDLEEAFSVERVTKEFYERYRKLFEDLSKNLKKNKAFQIIAEKENIDIDNFAKKLLGQIVFLYFLQKKGWLGVPQDKSWGQGDKFFLRTLFDKAKNQKKDFYNEYLEILFYDTLNNPRRDEVDPAYSRYFDCKIPFLNGGLFEPDYDWKNTFVSLGNDIFEEIIDTFNLYNFTVKEDEPLEKEVAVDPEMLGKVFENLLPENMRKGQGTYYTPREIVHYMCQESLINHLNTETKIDAERIRKWIAFKDEDLVNGNGSRKKTLGFSNEEIRRLDQALANIKVCDPACGSGAFLVGMLNEIVSARRILEPRSEYKLKKEAIQECIYGVDIDPGAVDIAKLRLWLTLVVDFELRDIEPLPNLDYKIMCGNSLLEELIVGEESIKLFDERLLNLKELKSSPPQDARQEELKKRLQEKQKELLDLHAKNKLSMAKKKELDSQILAINRELNPKAKKMKSEIYHPVFFAEQADEYFKRLRELHKQFFTEYDPIKKKERRKQIEDIELEFIKSSIKERVDELDSKIKNLNMQDPGDRKKQAVLMKKKLEYSTIPEQIRSSKTRPYFLWKLNFFEVFQEKGGFDVVIANPPYIKEDVNREAFVGLGNMDCYQGKMDIWYLFGSKGLDIIKEFGVLCFIATNNWISNDGASKFRNKIISQGRIIDFLDFGDHKIFSAGIQTMVFVILKDKDHKEYNLKYGRLLKDNVDNKTLEDFLRERKEMFNEEFVKFRTRFIRNDYIDKYITFLHPTNEKIINKIASGDRFFISDSEIFSGIDITQDFINKKHLEALGDKFSVGEGIFVLKSSEQNRIAWNKNECELFKPYYTTKEINRYHSNKENKHWIIYTGADINKRISNYPKIKNHLDKFQKVITSVNKPYGLHRPRENNNFMGEKILSIRKCSVPSFSFVDFPCYVSRAFLIIKTDRISLKYLSTILNSKLIKFWLRFKGKMQGNMFQVDKIPLMEVPIARASTEEQNLLVDAGKKIVTILTVKNDGIPMRDVEITQCERQIDQMVYKLYGLTPEEIDIVENS